MCSSYWTLLIPGGRERIVHCLEFRTRRAAIAIAAVTVGSRFTIRPRTELIAHHRIHDPGAAKQAVGSDIHRLSDITRGCANSDLETGRGNALGGTSRQPHVRHQPKFRCAVSRTSVMNIVQVAESIQRGLDVRWRDELRARFDLYVSVSIVVREFDILISLGRDGSAVLCAPRNGISLAKILSTAEHLFHDLGSSTAQCQSVGPGPQRTARYQPAPFPQPSPRGVGRG